MISRKGTLGILLVVAVLYMGAVVVSVLQYSYFLDDDYENFFLILHNSFWGYVFTLLDDQFVPLHRFFTYLIYALFPLSFPFAVGVLMTIHVLGVWYLWRILRLLGDSGVNKVLIFAYVTNVYFFVPLMWWSSGIHRFSYVLLSEICIYYYLRYRFLANRWHLLGSLGALGLTFFIYSKAALIPAYLLGLDLCLMQGIPGPKPIRRLLVLAPFFAMSGAHVIWYRICLPAALDSFTLDLQYLSTFVAQSFGFLSHGLFTLVYRPENTPLRVLIALACAGLVTYSVVRNRASIWIWLIGLGVISLNFLLIATSPRNVFGLGNVLTHRYYFELMFLVVIFLKLILNNIPAGRALSGLPERGRQVLLSTHVHLAMIVLYASLSFLHCRALMDTPRYARHRQTRAYMENLVTGITQFQAHPPANLSFAEGLVPEYAVGFRWKMRPYQVFLQLFKLNALHGVPTENFYRITETGEVQKVE